jgi:hypothetical protein
METTTVA